MGRAVILGMQLHGHVNPTLAVVQELVARGEEVIYYSSDAFKERLEQMGALYRPYDTLFTDMTLQTNPADFSLLVIKEALHILPQVLEDIRASEPDYIIYDTLCVAGRCVAHILDLPAIMLFTTHAGGILTRVQEPRKELPPMSVTHIPGALPQTDQPLKDVLMVRSGALGHVPPHMRRPGMPPGPGAMGAIPGPQDGQIVPEEQVAAIQAGIQAAIAELATTYNVPVSKPTDIYEHTEALNIVFVPREFQSPGKDFDESFVFVGPSILPSTTTASPVTRSAERPTLYISLGTLFNEDPEFFAMCLEAFGHSEWQVVMSIGSRVDPARLGDIPANFIVAPYHPQLAVLANTDVFITHGGMNSTMEALSLGVPLIVIPQMAEQAITAQRVDALGLGLALDKLGLNGEVLRSAAYRVLNEPSFRQEAAKMQVAISASGGYKQAADVIIRYIAEYPKAPALGASDS
ncbi:MAG TPA: nucleotide disphospho-sugar-binding domain-containing protein [Herpetosiphonaceae bacterium]